MKNSIIVLLFIVAFGVTLATVMSADRAEKCRRQHIFNVIEIDQECPQQDETE